MWSQHPLKSYTTTRPDLLPYALQFPSLFMATVVDNTSCPSNVPKELWVGALKAVKFIQEINIPSEPETTLELISYRIGTVVRVSEILSRFSNPTNLFE